MAHEDSKYEGSQGNGLYSVKLRAGRRRTYFFDVRSTRNNDYYVTITESKKRFNEDGYDRHKIFLYKEDFNQFLNSLNEALDHVKNDLLPDYDFDEFHRDRDQRRAEWANQENENSAESVNEQNPIEAKVETADADNDGEPLSSKMDGEDMNWQ